MAHAKELPEEVSKRIAADIGRRLPLLMDISLLSPPTIELGETFEVWMLGRDKIMGRGKEIRSMAQNTARLYHQIFLGGKPGAFARSKQNTTEPDQWQVAAVFLSPLAENIDKAIAWVDNNVQNDPLVVLLDVPSYFLHALWLMDNSNDFFLLASFPPQYNDFQYSRLYNSQDFLNLLRRRNPIIGRIP